MSFCGHLTRQTLYFEVASLELSLEEIAVLLECCVVFCERLHAIFKLGNQLTLLVVGMKQLRRFWLCFGKKSFTCDFDPLR